ncbi:MAG: hypothetical protein J3Q66DRAFT_412637, partial [Benniella sp.]
FRLIASVHRCSSSSTSPAITSSAPSASSPLLRFPSSPLFILCYNSPLLPDSHFTPRPQPTDTTMGPELLRVLRFCLVLLAFITFGIIAHTVRTYKISISDSAYWDVWLPFFLAIFCVIVYSWALKAQTAQKNIIQSNGARYIGSLILYAAWLASPSFTIHNILYNIRQYELEGDFFEYWNCGSPGCHLGFAQGICSFLMALFVLLELILAYLYERSFNVHRANPRPTTIVVGPPPVQQYPYNPAQPVQQFVYDPVLPQQPGQQPQAYYPQPVIRPVITAPYNQSPTFLEQAPAYQP